MFWRRGHLFSGAPARQDDISLCFTHIFWSSLADFSAALSQAHSEKQDEVSSLRWPSPARALWALGSGLKGPGPGFNRLSLAQVCICSPTGASSLTVDSDTLEFS